MINYNKEIDRENIEIFKRWEIQNPEEKRHKCVICRKLTSVSDSFSNNGHKLICRQCFMNHFNWDTRKLFEWQDVYW